VERSWDGLSKDVHVDFSRAFLVSGWKSGARCLRIGYAKSAVIRGNAAVSKIDIVMVRAQAT
jgi:hypothetical protein